MDFYQLAIDKQKASVLLNQNDLYAESIYMSCLAIELLLKSVMNRVPETEKLEFSHDILGMYRLIKKKYPAKTDMTHEIIMCRKYMNEARYPYNGTSVFTKTFAESFITYIENIKKYVDEECKATIEDLKRKFK